jgi:hypothetical protein
MARNGDWTVKRPNPILDIGLDRLGSRSRDDWTKTTGLQLDKLLY